MEIRALAGGRQEEKTDAAQIAEPEERTEIEKDSIANGEEVAANLLTVDEQIEMIAEAEDEKASAFAVSQEDIDSVLTGGSGIQNGKYRIYRQFQKQEDKKSNIDNGNSAFRKDTAFSSKAITSYLSAPIYTTSPS